MKKISGCGRDLGPYVYVHEGGISTPKGAIHCMGPVQKVLPSLNTTIPAVEAAN